MRDARGADPKDDALSAPKLLLDADLIIYRQCAAVERDISWGSVTGDETDEDTHTLVADAGEAFSGVERAVNRLKARFETEDVLLCISAGVNFRYSIDPTYKANRKGTRKPLAYNEVLKRAKDTWSSFEFPGLEADDILGIFGSREPDAAIICSADKDMKTIPCTLWDGSKLQKIDRATADWWFCYQTLVGDTADGYPGVPGVGPKKAQAILGPVGKLPIAVLWGKVQDAYAKFGLDEADAVKQARLARILRHEDWDAVKKEPILWAP